MHGQIDLSRQPVLTLLTCFAVAIIVLGGLIGCGGDAPVAIEKDNAGTTVTATTPQTTQPADPIVAAQQKAVGIWLGGAYLDEPKLEELLSNKTDEEKAALLTKAQNFLSMVMAVEFRSDGVMENEIEMQPEGAQQVMRESSMGNWRVVDADSERLIIETQTQDPNGQIVTDQKIYKFYEDGNHFAMMVPLQDELKSCNPLIIFERQNLSDAAVAENQTDTQMK